MPKSYCPPPTARVPIDAPPANTAAAPPLLTIVPLPVAPHSPPPTAPLAPRKSTPPPPPPPRPIRPPPSNPRPAAAAIDERAPRGGTGKALVKAAADRRAADRTGIVQRPAGQDRRAVRRATRQYIQRTTARHGHSAGERAEHVQRAAARDGEVMCRAASSHARYATAKIGCESKRTARE